METQTLKQMLETMTVGDKLLLSESRPTIFVNAKRANITVSTKLVNGQIEVTKTGNIEKPAIIPKMPKQKTVLERMQAATASQRLEWFEHFELCCGMNRGQCICEPDAVQATQKTEPIVAQPSRLEVARMALQAAEAKVYEDVEEGESEWKFTTEPVWYDETNTPYRRQWIQIGAKPTYRVVEVEEFDHEAVVRVR